MQIFDADIYLGESHGSLKSIAPIVFCPWEKFLHPT